MLKFEKITFAFAGAAVLTDVDFEAHPGQVTCLIGPSGCGKTTLLRLAAGLLPSQSGRVLLNDETLSAVGRDVAPEARPVGLVFQEGALFPHMDVEANVAFGLRGLPQRERSQRVQVLLEEVGLEGYANRYPHTLSGGQQQRVALARALAPRPEVLLFDEPYANLDAQRRVALREQARSMIQRTKTVALFVTHDPQEVLEMADQVVVMHRGRILQASSPTEIYDNPASHFVACLFGGAQSFAAVLSSGGVESEFGNWPASCLAAGADLDGPVRVVVRPDGLTVTGGAGTCTIRDIRLSGSDSLVILQAPSGATLRVSVDRPHAFAIGDSVDLAPTQAGRIFAFPEV